MRSDVIEDLTRDARNSLSAIIGYSEMLSEDLGDDHPWAVEDLDKIRIASRRVLSMVAMLEHQVDHARAEAALDPLTGVANRRHFTARSEALLAETEVEVPISLVLIDVDRFKEINDTHGHLAGDAVLKEIVRRARGATRDSDMLARFAGDEFVLLLPRTPQAEAMRVAARVKDHIARAPMVTDKAEVSVTVSCGVATRIDLSCSLDALLERADRAMYAAKRAGRDRVSSSD
jgi:two-component system cell cycle response regulator